MADILKMILWIAVTSYAGWACLSLLSRKKALLTAAEKLALSYPLGLGLITIEMALLPLFNIKFSPLSILALPVLAIFAAFALQGKKQTRAGGYPAKESGKFSFLEKFMLAGIFFEAAYTFFRALIKPLESYDAVAIYAVKAKIFYLAGSVPKDFFSAFKDAIPHIEYPLLLPLSETYFYTFLGNMNDLLVKMIFPLYYVSLIAIFYCVLRRCMARKESLVFTFLMATIPQFAEYATNGYADFILTFYYSASFLCLFLWTRERHRGFVYLSLLFSALSLWAKTDAIILIIANMLAVAVYLSAIDRQSLKGGLFYIASSALLVAAYLSIKRSIGIALSGDFIVKSFPDIGRIPLILYKYQIEFFGPKKWNISWIIFLFLFFINLRKAFSKNLNFISSVIVMAFLGYTFVYMVTPQDLSWHLSKSVSRLFIHFLPVVILWIAIFSKEAGLDI